MFNTNDKYIDAKARFIAWASANNETIDSITYQLGKMANNGLNETILGSDLSGILIIIITTAFAAIAGIYLFKKKAMEKISLIKKQYRCKFCTTLLFIFFEIRFEFKFRKLT